MDPVLTVAEVEVQSALIRQAKASNPFYNSDDTQMALDLATADIDGRGSYDESHENYERNMRLATILLVDKHYTERDPNFVRFVVQGMILERTGDYMVQLDPKATRDDFCTRIDDHVDSLLGVLLEGAGERVKIARDHVFSGKPYPKCPDVKF